MTRRRKPTRWHRATSLVATTEVERWLAENRDAIDAYNEQIERREVFGEGYRF
jgi:hypothetical protein